MKPTITLNTGKEMPRLGMGTWQSDPGKVGKAVEYALTEAGYKHIDCASVYGNEPEIGQAFSKVFDSGKVKRSDIFITSKLWNTEHHPDNVEKACKQTLNDLQIKYLDLYLIHWGIPFKHGKSIMPMGDDGIVSMEPVAMIDTWRAMEKLVKKGLVKAIGVSNFTGPMLVDLLAYAKIQPAINQIELHPYNPQPELIEFCHKKKIQVTAYSPLGSTGNEQQGPMSDKAVIKIAKRHGKGPAQVLIRWALQRDTIVIPKSTHIDRIQQNIEVFDFKLFKNEVEQINALSKNQRFVDPSEMWGIPYFK